MDGVPTITVVSPSDAIRATDPADVAAAMRWLSDVTGWVCEPADGWDDVAENGAAGDPELRAEVLTRALESSDAVFCSAGGDHAHELLEHLDLERLAAAPGWFVGTSDNSMLAVALASVGVTAFCGPDLKVVPGLDGVAELGAARPLDFAYTRAELTSLFTRAGTEVSLPLPPGPSGEVRALRSGNAQGRLVAVNLRCLLKLAAVPGWWPADLLDGAVLLVEGFSAGADDYTSMLDELAGLGVLDRVAALGFGWLYAVDGPGGDGRFDAVAAAALELTPEPTPVWRLPLFGHRCPHAVLPTGAPARLVDGALSVRWPRTSR